MLPLLVAGVVLTAAVGYIISLWRSPAYTAALTIIAIVFFDCLQIGAGGFHAGISIYPDDVACAVLVAYAVFIVVQRRDRFAGICWPALVLVCLGLVSFFRGALLLGLQPAGNGIRSMMYIAIPFACLSVTEQRYRKPAQVLAWICGFAVLFSVIAFGRWTGIVPMPVYEFVDDFREVQRVLPADYPMIIGYAFITAIGWQVARGVRLSYLLAAGLFGVIVIVVQHRSVWVATSVGLLWLFIRSVPQAARRWVQLGAVASATAIAVTVLLVSSGYMDTALSLLTANIKEPTHQDSTLAWRLAGFSEALERTVSSGLIDLTIGPPAGKDLTGLASAASVHIHNRYIESLAFYGLAGGAVFAASLALLIRYATRLSGSSGITLNPVFSGVVLESIVFACCVYLTAYDGTLVHGCLLGMLWAATKNQETSGSKVLEEAAGVSPVPVYQQAV